MRTSIRRSAQALLRRHWAEKHPFATLALAPPAALYGAAVAARNVAYDRGWLPSIHPGIPVISVGNVVVGGGGENPVSAWIAGVLEERGHRPAVISRGYGLDEVALHRFWNPRVPVHVDPDRVRGAESARAEGCDCVVLDDGFQHRRISRDLDIALHPVAAPLVSRLLPHGPYREPLKSLARADLLILTSKSARDDRIDRARSRLRALFPRLPLAEMRLEPDGWSDLHGGPAPPPEGPVLAVTGIARPETFRQTLTGLLDADIELVAFPDHHEFTPQELGELVKEAGERPILLTEKDAVRIRASGQAPNHPIRILRLAVREGDGCPDLRGRLTSLLERNRERRDPAPGTDGGLNVFGKGRD